jgi:hypothetical protein
VGFAAHLIAIEDASQSSLRSRLSAYQRLRFIKGPSLTLIRRGRYDSTLRTD